MLLLILKPVDGGCRRPPLAVICSSLLLLLRLSLPPQRSILVILLLAIKVDLLGRGHTVSVLVCPPSVVVGGLLLPILLLRPPICGGLPPSRRSRLEVQRRLPEVIRLPDWLPDRLPDRLLPVGHRSPPGAHLAILLLLHCVLWLPSVRLRGAWLALFKLYSR